MLVLEAQLDQRLVDLDRFQLSEEIRIVSVAIVKADE